MTSPSSALAVPLGGFGVTDRVGKLLSWYGLAAGVLPAELRDGALTLLDPRPETAPVSVATIETGSTRVTDLETRDGVARIRNHVEATLAAFSIVDYGTTRVFSRPVQFGNGLARRSL